MMVRDSKCARVRGSVHPVSLAIGVGALIAIAVFTLLFTRRVPEPAAPQTPRPAESPRVEVDTLGWDSEPVRLVRSLYEGAFDADEELLVRSLDGARLAERSSPADSVNAVDFAALDAPARQAYLRAVAQEIIRGRDADSPRWWKPVEGRVTRLEALDAQVRITADKRVEPGSNAAVESRTYEWELRRADENSRWRACSWERTMTDEERRAFEATGRHEVTFVTLEDGSALFQAEMRPIDDYPDTSDALREQIAKSLATMLDFRLRPPENTVARDELLAIGRHAVPQLLSKLHEIELVDDPDDPSLAQINLIDGVLRSITGYRSSFSPLPGQTAQRRTMALKAWFAWWERTGRNLADADAGKRRDG